MKKKEKKGRIRYSYEDEEEEETGKEIKEINEDLKRRIESSNSTLNNYIIGNSFAIYKGRTKKLSCC